MAMRIPLYITSRKDIVQCEMSKPVALAYAATRLLAYVILMAADLLLLPRTAAIFTAGVVMFVAPTLTDFALPWLFLRIGVIHLPEEEPAECWCAACVAARASGLLSALATFAEKEEMSVAATELDAFASRVTVLFSDGGHEAEQLPEAPDAKSEQCPLTGEAECRACIADEVAADLQMLGELKQKDADGCAIPLVSWEAETICSFAHSLRAMFPHPDTKEEPS